MHLSRCLRALDEFSLSWESANCAKEFFMKLQAQWKIRARSVKSACRSDAVFEAARTQSGNPIGTAANDSENILFTQLEESHFSNMDLD
jgi:hypothetical protein